MKWFKHDSDAFQDPKVIKLVMRQGLEGYGFYFALVELISYEVSPQNFSFSLEHDNEVLAHKFGITQQRVVELLQTCLDLRLFAFNSENKICCPTLAKRLDNSLAQNKDIKKCLTNFKSFSKDFKFLEADIELDVEVDKNNTSKEPKKESLADKRIPYSQILEIYHLTCPTLPRVVKLTAQRKRYIKQRWDEDKRHQNKEFWEKYFQIVLSSDFLMGRSEPKYSGDRVWSADFEWLIKPNNFIKVIENKY